MTFFPQKQITWFEDKPVVSDILNLVNFMQRKILILMIVKSKEKITEFHIKLRFSKQYILERVKKL